MVQTTIFKILKYAAIFVALLLVWIFFIKRLNPVPQGMVLVEQATVDSLRAYVLLSDSLEVIANQPPDTVRIDTIIYDTEIIYVETTPAVDTDPIDENIKTYTDSLIIDGKINAWVKFKVNGYLIENVRWQYKPVIKEVITTVEKKIPYPVIETINIPTPINGHYLSAVAGGNSNLFTFGVDYDLIKSNKVYGLQYRRYNDQNIYSVKLGINLATLFKKNL